MRTNSNSAFPTVRSEGGLLPPDLLTRIVAGDSDLGGMSPQDFGLAPTDRLGEAISRAWGRVKAYWSALQASREGLPEADTGVTETREQWVLPLLRELGYGRLEHRAAAEEIEGRRYLISHRSASGKAVVPVHVVSFRQDLDHSRREAGTDGVRLSPHSLVQEYLNRGGSLLGIVTNGLQLRLLRDNHSLTRMAFVEFDLEAMMEGGVYSDFVLLYLSLHRTRLPVEGAEAGQCWLERWREKAEGQGVRALGELRKGVEDAITALGTGFLAHSTNDALRSHLRGGELTTADYFTQLLRLVYRLLFLFVAEERDLLHPADAGPADKQRYVDLYSATRVRSAARRHRADERHDDLWRGLRVTFDLLAGRRSGLGLSPLAGGLFGEGSCPDLDGCQLSNSALAEAAIRLSYVKTGRLVRRVNYRDMDSEELGGVYEGLLERQPRVRIETATFELVGSGERKTSGSYYTPSSLVQELIKSALEPVIAERLAKRKTADEKERALLRITVCDPACGSGHFLLAASRRLADELARLRAGDSEPTPGQIRHALRDVIRCCIYGVDLN
ncbi:MAG TPA: N-6 DNA methylase, partial [Chloroflexota bacterium]|nr:N-6 DNA methylase [Chloroflexota bacterium]